MISKNSKSNGFTLVEVLAAFVLFIIISLITYQIIHSAQAQNVQQSNETVQINDAAFFLKQITKDIRKSTDVTTTVLGNETTYAFKGSSSSITYTYLKNENELSRNNTLIVNQLKDFQLSIVDQTITLSFSINGKQYATKIILRKGQS